jgi:hypothetical protein
MPEQNTLKSSFNVGSSIFIFTDTFGSDTQVKYGGTIEEVLHEPEDEVSDFSNFQD